MQKEHHNIAPGMAKAKSISVKEVDTIIVFTILIASYGHNARVDIQPPLGWQQSHFVSGSKSSYCWTLLPLFCL